MAHWIDAKENGSVRTVGFMTSSKNAGLARLAVTGTLAVAGFAAPAAVSAIDFETDAERARQPRICRDTMQAGVTNAFASSGDASFFFRMRPWKEGEDEWPLFVLRTGKRDWSGFDRLVIDMVNLDLGGDTMNISVASDGIAPFSGLAAVTTLKPCGFTQWVVPLEKWPDGMGATNVSTIGFCVTRPAGCEVFVDGFRLLKPGEPVPCAAYSDASKAAVAKRQTAYAAERTFRTELMKSKLRLSGKPSGGMLVGQATTMEHKRPTETFDLEPADVLRIRLARNEYEGVQVFAVPDGADLKSVSVSVSSLAMAGGGTIPAKDMKVYAVGYVKTLKSPNWRLVDANGGTVKPPVGWWPDPLLDFVPRADVKVGTVQGFWINVRADESLAAGNYCGIVTVSAENAASVDVPIEVRVNDFTLPRTAVIPTAISFHPPIIHTYDKASEARKKDPKDITNIWKPHEDAWTDLAADHLISVDYLYPAVKPRFRQLMRLKEQGRLGWFNLSYWRHSDEEGVTGSEKWKKAWFTSTDKCYRQAKELGILDHAYLYGEDEIPEAAFPKVAIAAKCYKERYPEVPLLTTAFDADFGINGSPLSAIDWFTPLTDKYDLKKAEASRASGHRVWWYVSCLPTTRWANLFVEKEPIEARLLMGGMAERMKVDGFLFYSICAWGKNRKPIETGPYTDWDPVSYENNHGDGSWIYCGPDGMPVPTIRLENYRDGLEDLAYAKLLKERRGIEMPAPDDVMRSMTDFTLRPEPLLRWRNRMADLLEGRVP